ncbi:MAG: hypothetical protein JWN37_482 [Candidatus Nomurabacteria bacterium]|nr:hypothetical protein [Candidatus Nomurabacteria bacterium]
MPVNKHLPNLDPEYMLDDYGAMLNLIRNQYDPPLPIERIETIKKAFFLGIDYMQERGFIKRKIIDNAQDVEKLQLFVRDFTEEGLLFYRTKYQNYLTAIDKVSTIPEEAVKRYLKNN